MMVSLPRLRVAHVRTIGFSNINLTPVSVLVEREKHPGLGNEIYETFVERSDDVTVLMEEAISQALNKSGVAPESVDAVYFASEGHWEANISRINRMVKPSRPRRAFRNGLMGILHDLGLENAYAVGLWMSDCGNGCEALLHAKSAIVSGQHDRVLVVIGDRRNTDLPRIEEDDHVYSDMATAILIDNREGVIIGEGVGQTYTNRIYVVDPEEALETYQVDLSKVRYKFEARTNISIDHYDHYIIGNWSSSWLDTAVDFLRLDESKIRMGTAKQMAHAQGSDQFLNLDSLLQSGSKPGDRGILVSTSPLTAHLVALTF